MIYSSKNSKTLQLKLFIVSFKTSLPSPSVSLFVSPLGSPLVSPLHPLASPFSPLATCNQEEKNKNEEVSKKEGDGNRG